METRLLAEIESLLQRDDTDLGKVWQMSRQGVNADAMAQRLQCTPGHVNNVQMQISVLRGEPLPSAPSRRLKAAQKIGGWLESKPLTPALESHLKELRITLRGHTDVVDHPTVDWVKRPVALATGLPTGQPIRMRHLPDGCLHFYPDPKDPSRLL